LTRGSSLSSGVTAAFTPAAVVIVVTPATDCRDARAERDHRKQACQLCHILIPSET
jgi:hypothetical protein